VRQLRPVRLAYHRSVPDNLADVPHPATTHDDNDKTHDLPVPDGATADEWNTITAQPSDIVRSLTGTGRYC
jgi:hypothetical protein